MASQNIIDEQLQNSIAPGLLYCFIIDNKKCTPDWLFGTMLFSKVNLQIISINNISEYQIIDKYVTGNKYYVSHQSWASNC